MRVLALDTTTGAGSVAVTDGDRLVVDVRGNAARSHAERLPADLLAALDRVPMTLADVDVFAVASGPGSFTGLRIGIATMQGLAFVQQKRIVPVSVLFALAIAGAATLEEGAVVGAWMDAHRGEVFSALYRVTGAPMFAPERLVELEPPAVGDPATIWTRWRRLAEPAAIVGDGAVQYATAIGDSTRAIEPPPLAGIIGCVAAVRAARGDSVTPAGVQPLYVRRPDAEIARDAARGQPVKGRP
jgi:tRNA threonylcarbamoyladenosine biosynthesis protein TsaB